MPLRQEDIEYIAWLSNQKWVCECKITFYDMREAEDHQAETDHCMKREKIDPSK